jgi:hypothetical protein
MFFTFFIQLLFPHDGGDGLGDGQVLPVAAHVSALEILDSVKGGHGQSKLPIDHG